MILEMILLKVSQIKSKLKIKRPIKSNMPKIVNQRMDIINALANNPRNYFVNTAG